MILGEESLKDIWDISMENIKHKFPIKQLLMPCSLKNQWFLYKMLYFFEI